MDASVTCQKTRRKFHKKIFKRIKSQNSEHISESSNSETQKASLQIAVVN